MDGAISACLKLQKSHKLILYTMRSGETLDEAVAWCAERGLKFWAVNENPEQKKWTDSPKIYANIYIDDAAFGCPLKDIEFERPVVDWSKVVETLKIGEQFMVEIDFRKTGVDIAKNIIGMRIEDAEQYAEQNGFVLSSILATCRFKSNRIQYDLQNGLITSAIHG